MQNTYTTPPVIDQNKFRIVTNTTHKKAPFGRLKGRMLPRMDNDNREATRIDFMSYGRSDEGGPTWNVQKMSEEVQGPGWVRALPVEISEYADFNVDAALEYLAANGWHVRRFFPFGARAWKGSKRPVRTKRAIIKIKDQIRLGHHYASPAEGSGQTHGFDLAFDL